MAIATSSESIDFRALQQTWKAFDSIARLRPIRSAMEYDSTVGLMNGLLDTVGDKEDHPLAGLLDLVSSLVEEYDKQHYAIEASEPREALRHLMQIRGLKQVHLVDVVPQGNLSAILSGRRKISAKLAGRLAKYFGVSPALFIPAG
jgi:HTH-type transcriptional regulator/antitoxin HigA